MAVNYYNIYKDNLSTTTKEEVSEYENMLQLYYSDDIKCPADKSKKIKKYVDEDGNMVMSCESANWLVKLEPAENIDLHNLLTDKETELREIFFKLKSENKNVVNFEADIKSLQQRFNVLNNEVKSIQQIFEEHYGEMKTKNREQSELYGKLIKTGIEKKMMYSKIKDPVVIGKTNKEKLAVIYKHEGMPKEKRLKEISKQLSLDEGDIIQWFAWFDKSKECMRIQIDLTRKTQEINDISERFTKNTNFFQTQAPRIIEEKTVSLGKKLKVKKKEDEKDLFLDVVPKKTDNDDVKVITIKPPEEYDSEKNMVEEEIEIEKEMEDDSGNSDKEETLKEESLKEEPLEEESMSVENSAKSNNEFLEEEPLKEEPLANDKPLEDQNVKTITINIEPPTQKKKKLIIRNKSKK